MHWAIDDLQARARAQLNALHDYSDQLGAIRVKASSADGLVTAEVDGVGALTGLWLSPTATAHGAASIGEAVVAAAALAAQRAFAQRATLTDEFHGTFADLSQSS